MLLDECRSYDVIIIPESCKRMGAGTEKFKKEQREGFEMSNLSERYTGFPIFTVIVFIIGMLLSCCAQTPITGAPLDRATLVDGTYEGSYKAWPNRALVKVEIKDNKIVGIEIVEHWAWKGKKAESLISERIIRNQSTNVDAVSGATNSSRVIMNAVQNAIEKAYQRPLSQ